MSFQIKPGVPKRYLLLMAAVVWLFAGGFLLCRSIRMIQPDGLLWLKVLLAVIVGLVFFHLIFLRISLKHIARIRSLEILRPCVFSFFDWKSYLVMIIMISAGILIRKTGWIDIQWISLFFISMATPLLLSAARFFRAWWRFHELISP
jgi:hypothetical protein